METTKIIELLSYTLPAIITGGVAFLFFKNFTKNEENRRRFLLMKENNKTGLPLKLQAYERLTLFLERINPSKLLIRIAPVSTDKVDYANYLIAHIEQEFEHNITQQIYISNECWTVILTAKNTIIQTIRKVSISTEINNADDLRSKILENLLETQSPSDVALAFIKNEISSVF